DDVARMIHKFQQILCCVSDSWPLLNLLLDWNLVTWYQDFSNIQHMGCRTTLIKDHSK
ncbi:hypothetical protein NDU88_001474, partial [Pleurodeles waltl]